MELGILFSYNHQRMHPGYGKACGCKCCDRHVQRLLKPGRVEHGFYRIDIEILPVHIIEPSRAVHPTVGSNNQDTRYNTADANNQTRKPVEPGVEPVPAVKEKAKRN